MDMRWLELRGRNYYAVKAVPRPLRRALGKKTLIKSLETRDHHVAVARRHSALAEFERTLERARQPGQTDALTVAALEWRKTLDGYETGAIEGSISQAYAVLNDEADRVRRDHGPEAAASFVGLARGTATPLLHHLDAWLREGGSKGALMPRTIKQYRSDVGTFAEWAKARGITTLEGVTRATAGRYVTEELIERGVHPATGNRRLAALMAFWRHMRKRAGLDLDPWHGQAIADSNGRSAEKPKRAFTDEEVSTLLSGDADAEIHDAMRIAALSGLRLEEIYRLRVSDCAAGWFNVREPKTRAGIRRVPIHSDLGATVQRRCEGKKSDAFLFHEAKRGREHGANISRRFMRYRQRLGVHERGEGARSSKVDFHSWRRWFITQARNAGIDRAVVAAVVGHAMRDITDGTYHGGPSEALLQACVEAVRLPG
jgi:integrase